MTKEGPQPSKQDNVYKFNNIYTFCKERVSKEYEKKKDNKSSQIQIKPHKLCGLLTSKLAG